MSGIYDNWEKLVGAVLKREELRRLALCESFSSSSISADFSSHFSFGSALEDVPPVGNNNLTPDEARSYPVMQLPGQKSKHTGFAFDSPGYESFFASHAGVYVPKKAWDVARRDSMRSLPKTLRKN